MLSARFCASALSQVSRELIYNACEDPPPVTTVTFTEGETEYVVTCDKHSDAENILLHVKMKYANGISEVCSVEINRLNPSLSKLYGESDTLTYTPEMYSCLTENGIEMNGKDGINRQLYINPTE